MLLISIPVGLLVTAILHANNMRDLEEDLANNKRTLANIFGRRASRWEYYLLVGGSYVLLGLLIVVGVAPWFMALAFLTLPTAVKLIQTTAIHEMPAQLNKVVRGTATLHQRFGWLAIAGVLAAILFQIA